MNLLIPGRTEEEKKENKKEYDAQWREANKDHIKERSARWREDNKEYMKEYGAQWYQDNKEQQKEQMAQYYEKNRESINAKKQKERIKCPRCDMEMRKDSLRRHIKRKHE